MAAETQVSSTQSRQKWTLGILNTPDGQDVPGSILLLTNVEDEERSQEVAQTPTSTLKTTGDGKIVLEPQPDDSLNDPLMWPMWKRNAALFSLGFYCMLGGGVTPILAAGFQDVADTFHTPLDTVAMTTGMLMLGLGIGGVLVSPTAILFGKRIIYICTAIVFMCACIWCAKANSYTSLLLARFVQGMALSPIEVIPSASISELFYLHERAFRLGIYTLLLLSGKNLIPLVSAAIINADGWRWVFWILAMATAAAIILMFFCLPETFWDRSESTGSSLTQCSAQSRPVSAVQDNLRDLGQTPGSDVRASIVTRASTINHEKEEEKMQDHPSAALDGNEKQRRRSILDKEVAYDRTQHVQRPVTQPQPTDVSSAVEPDGLAPESAISSSDKNEYVRYTDFWRASPPKTYSQSLGLFFGRLSDDNWLVAATRPFVLFTYPAVLWSAMVYALSIGWLIVLSESVSEIYRSRHTYSFTSFQAGLVYLAPFIGAIFGTAIAGKCSDYIVQFMARKNNGIYEPEFRLVMAIPVAITTAIGLMGFGWSVEQKDAWIVPTVFFGIISFGCSLGSTTAITFVVDSYKQYAAEALVTLNFSKNIFHGFIFSLFFPHWLQSKGGKPVFIILGVIHLICMIFTIPMYIYGKRARLWTARTALVQRLERSKKA